MATDDDLKTALKGNEDDDAHEATESSLTARRVQGGGPETTLGPGENAIRIKHKDGALADSTALAAGDESALVNAREASELDADHEINEAHEADAPMQLGYMRFVYAAYMAGAMLVAFLIAKIVHVGWYRLGQWKTEFGEPRDEVIYVVSGLLGVLVAVYYWRKSSSRQYAKDVAEELSKVTWPSRKEVTNSTTVVLFYTLFATVFFALMDQFWKYITDKIYSF